MFNYVENERLPSIIVYANMPTFCELVWSI